jgi:hypothetical protein
MPFLSELLPGHVGRHDVRYIRQPEGGVMCASTSKSSPQGPIEAGPPGRADGSGSRVPCAPAARCPRPSGIAGACHRSHCKPVAWSPGTKLGMLMLRGYLLISVLLLIVKAVQLRGAELAARKPRPGMTARHRAQPVRPRARQPEANPSHWQPS